MKTVLCLLSALCACSHAFWLRNQERTATADGRDVDETCIAQAREGGCGFYTCFEQRLPCGRDFYMSRFGVNYCNRFRTFRNSFTEQGKAFLDASQRCLAEGLVTTYRRDYVNCHALEHEAVGLITPCYTEHGFCTILSDNARAFVEVFQLNDLFRPGAAKLWREMVSLARTCGSRELANFMRAATAQVSRPLRNFLSLFSRDD